jgi:hypothetical protein
LSRAFRPAPSAWTNSARAADALDQHAHAGRRLGHLPDHGNGPDAVQVVDARLLGVAVLHEQQDHPVPGQRAVHAFDRHRPAHAERRDGHRQDHRTPQRHDGQFGGERRSLRSVLGHRLSSWMRRLPRTRSAGVPRTPHGVRRTKGS